MLSGLTARMAQALQVNLEHSTDILCQDSEPNPSASTKESRRRLMWSCYITDSLVGSGVDQLTLIKEAVRTLSRHCFSEPSPDLLSTGYQNTTPVQRTKLPTANAMHHGSIGTWTVPEVSRARIFTILSVGQYGYQSLLPSIYCNS